MKQKILIATTFLLFTSSLCAYIQPIIKIGYDTGGYTLKSLDEDRLKIGSGFIGEGGLSFRTPELGRHLKGQIFLGYKLNQLDHTNGVYDFSRVTLSAIELYNTRYFHIGAGVTYHFSPTLDYTDDRSSNFDKQTEYDDALGFIFQLGFNLSREATLGIKGTIIDYELPNSAISRDGNSLGVFLSFKF